MGLVNDIIQEQKEDKKNALIKKLQDIEKEHGTDFEVAHIRADEELIEYIGDKDIEEAFNNIGKWYA